MAAKGSAAFVDYVLSGRFEKIAGQAVADAIATAKAHGLRVEGYANTAAPPPPQRARAGRVVQNSKTRPLRRAA